MKNSLGIAMLCRRANYFKWRWWCWLCTDLSVIADCCFCCCCCYVWQNRSALISYRNWKHTIRHQVKQQTPNVMRGSVQSVCMLLHLHAVFGTQSVRLYDSNCTNITTSILRKMVDLFLLFFSSLLSYSKETKIFHSFLFFGWKNALCQQTCDF